MITMKLTELARKAIEFHLKGEEFNPAKDVKKKYEKKVASFVTLTKNNELRGCIGSLEAIRELWEDVIKNAVNAGFRDPRFPALRGEELSEIKIEVSVLTEPKKIIAKSVNSKLGKINSNMGIILKNGMNTSTFLPQVWEEIPDKIDFLEHLSMKAGLPKNAWKDAELWYYTVNAEEE
ncbi:MAG TPA: AmmeMemoRadiSam system protein A [Candidatus Nanoarchaeia archaeon]|nr:AmmeMemoRadiSam system protein A [Candidatus Nanoarchaeia archaeon]